MKLTEVDLRNQGQWTRAGITLPRFDRASAARAAKPAPAWLHFGTGNISGAYLAAIAQTLLEKGRMDSGLVMVSGTDLEIIDRIYRPHDNLILQVVLKANGSIDKRVLASVVEALKADAGTPDFTRMKEAFASPTLRMATFTITEKGYSLSGPGGQTLPAVLDDLAAGPATPKSYLGLVASLLHERYRAGGPAIAMVSMDNCSHNGDRLYRAITAYAEGWAKAGLADRGFSEYIRDPARVSFPWTMIDKITPRPDPVVKGMLKDVGFESADIVVTATHSYVAPFVNAEETGYLVIEDCFPGGRPALEEAGVIFADRQTVEKVEQMKVGTCLNPLHTALAVFGCLLGYQRINAEMADDDLKRLVEGIGYREGLPAAVNPGIIRPEDFLREVLTVRLPNPFLPDTPQRIATDTSQKLAPRFGGTIREYLARPDLRVDDLRLIPLVYAGWCRYLLGSDDQGNRFEVSPDPRYQDLAGKLAGLEPGKPGSFPDRLEPILSDESIFGVNLYRAGLGQTVEALFGELMAGPGSVRGVLHRMTHHSA